MQFRAFHLQHGQRAPWARITHVKLKANAVADTVQGQQVLDHIRVHSDRQGIAEIARIAPGFPARKSQLPPLQSMRVDLRHMANSRDAGENELNKGLLELGWLEDPERSEVPRPARR